MTQKHVLTSKGDVNADIEHLFGSPNWYELVHADKRYLPRAIVGLSYRYSLGRLLWPE